MDCYAEMEELDWNELMLALNSADTCRLNINNKLQP
jgi:hypothetical protein